MKTLAAKPQHKISVGGDSVAAPAPTGSKPGAEKSAPGLSSPCAHERVRILLGICRAIDRHVESGRTARAQFRKFARRWSGAVYRAEPSRRVQLSADSLKRIYYGRWLRSGRDANALHHRYGGRGHRFTLSVAQRRRVRVALAKAKTFRELYQMVFTRARRRPSETIFQRSFTRDERHEIATIFALRRKGRSTERAFAAWVSDSSRKFAIGGRR